MELSSLVFHNRLPTKVLSHPLMTFLHFFLQSLEFNGFIDVTIYFSSLQGPDDQDTDRLHLADPACLLSKATVYGLVSKPEGIQFPTELSLSIRYGDPY